MDADEIRFTAEKIGSKKEWLGVEIKPINRSDVIAVTTAQYNELKGYGPDVYSTKRGYGRLLKPDSQDYGRLPNLSGQTALEIIKNLPAGSEWLDLGCGSGVFVYDVLRMLNKKVKPVGFDARTWEDQKDIPELVLGNINELDLSMFKNNPDGFDLITSAAVFYHLHDHLSVFKKATTLLKPNGKLLVSTVNQPTYQGKSILDDEGKFKIPPGPHTVNYHRNRNYFTSSGELMAIGDVVSTINNFSHNILLEYTNCRVEQRVSTGEDSHGGGFSAMKIGPNASMNLSHIFYCYYPETGSTGSIRDDISYIVAKTDSEAQALKNQGFVSLE